MLIADSSASPSDDFKYKNAPNENSRQYGLQSASRFLGLAYVFAHLGVVLLVPIPLLAAAMLAIGDSEGSKARLNGRASGRTVWA
jgi:hypothetical protein